MKNNLYQKIVIALYLGCLGLIVVFFVPYRGVDINEFDSIWSDKSGLNNLRFFMEILILTIVFYIFYFLVAKFENPDFNAQKTKKFIKREIKIFLIFLTINLISLLYSLFNQDNHIGWSCINGVWNYNYGIWEIQFYTLTVSFGILYVLRLLYYYCRRLYLYLK